MERRLAAIFAADVAGYSRLVGADEEGTLARLRAHRRELIDPKIAEHQGRIVKTTGDGVLAEFASPVKAVRCAVEVQHGMPDRNAGVLREQRIEFRIGINLGDVIVEEGDIYGDGVNVAARLESIAEPGAVYLSRAVRDFVRDQPELVLEDLGERALKNIAKPVQVFRIGAPVRAAGMPQVAAPPLVPDKPSIAVLPFTNMSGDAGQEYFSDGMTEDLITDLSKVSSLFVIARNSSFAYKGKSVMAAPTSRCQLDLILFLVDSAAVGGGKWGCHMNGDISVSWLLRVPPLRAGGRSIARISRKPRPAYGSLFPGRKPIKKAPGERSPLCAVRSCPVAAVKAWRDAAAITAVDSEARS